MKKFISMLLIISMLTPLVACGNNPEEPASDDASQSTTPSAEETSPEETEPANPNALENLLPAANFGGRDFRISCTSKYSYEMAVDEINGEACNDAVYARNEKISNLYNVNIVPVITDFVSNETQINEIIANVSAGDDVYDLVGVYTYLAGQGVLEGCYHSWNDIPNVDFSREWWVQSANEAFTYGGERYVAIGDLSITALLLTYAVYFNRNLAVDYNIPNLYEIVKNGEWTIDKMLELSSNLFIDVNGDGAPDDGDKFGVVLENNTNVDVYTSAFDIDLVKKDENDRPIVDIDMERMAKAVEKVYQLYYENNNATRIFWDENEVVTFGEGRSLFLTTWLYQSFTKLRDMEDDYGIIPYPKLDEAQTEYYTNSMDNYSLLSVPITVKTEDLGFVGHITEALTIESHNKVLPAYYDVTLRSKYASDPESVEMLDIIMAGRKYDFSILHGGTLANLPYMLRSLISTQKKDFASLYKSNKKGIDKGMKILGESYDKLLNRE